MGKQLAKGITVLIVILMVVIPVFFIGVLITCFIN